MMNTARIAFAAALVLGTAACDQSREMLGLDQQGPDEFAVYSRAPLSLPPDYGLKPPAPGTSRSQVQDPRNDARQALVGDKAGQDGGSSAETPGLQALYQKTGANEADPSVRETINRETSILAEEDKSVTDRIMFWGTPTQYGTVVDPAREQKRIQENQALGKPLNEGEVPTMERKRKALLEDVF